jgi:hypothetical protein
LRIYDNTVDLSRLLFAQQFIAHILANRLWITLGRITIAAADAGYQACHVAAPQ